MFHSWCMGSNLGNLDDSQEDGDARTGFLFVAKFYSVSHEMLAAYFEKISGTGADDQTLSGSVSFGSRPRFGDEVMEIGVAASDKCGIRVECDLVWCRVWPSVVQSVVALWFWAGWKLVDSVHNSTL